MARQEPHLRTDVLIALKSSTLRSDVFIEKHVSFRLSSQFRVRLISLQRRSYSRYRQLFLLSARSSEIAIGADELSLELVTPHGIARCSRLELRMFVTMRIRGRRSIKRNRIGTRTVVKSRDVRFSISCRTRMWDANFRSRRHGNRVSSRAIVSSERYSGRHGYILFHCHSPNSLEESRVSSMLACR